MASLLQLAPVSGESPPRSSGKKQVINTSTSSPSPAKDKDPLPSSPDSDSAPFNKTHAREVRRRTDRRTEPLPAPGVGQSGSGNSTNGSSWRHLRPNGSSNGDYDSDSDSDDDRRRRKRYDGRDDDSDAAATTKREKRSAPPSLHYSKASNRPSAIVYGDYEERFHRSMQQSLALVGRAMEHYPSPRKQLKQMPNLFTSMPPGTRPDAIRSGNYDAMLEYLETLSEKVIESHTKALRRQQTNSPSEDEGDD